MTTFLLIIHTLVAVALLGSLTHQAVAACWPSASKAGFVASYRSVSAARFTNVNIALYVTMLVLGGVIYPAYRVGVRTYLESARLYSSVGYFEMKEQFVTIGLGLLPLFWLLWRQPLEKDLQFARAATTFLLCFIVWFSFIVGHLLVNVRGLFGL
jgi:hypothetical protein